MENNSVILLEKPDGKVQVIYENYKFSKTSYNSIARSKDYRCTDP